MEFRCFPTMPAAAHHAWFFGNRSRGTASPASADRLQVAWASIAPDPIRVGAGLRAKYLRRPPVPLGGKPGEDAGFRPQTGGLATSLALVNAARRQASSLSPLNQSTPQSDK